MLHISELLIDLQIKKGKSALERYSLSLPGQRHRILPLYQVDDGPVLSSLTHTWELPENKGQKIRGNILFSGDNSDPNLTYRRSFFYYEGGDPQNCWAVETARATDYPGGETKVGGIVWLFDSLPNARTLEFTWRHGVLDSNAQQPLLVGNINLTETLTDANEPRSGGSHIYRSRLLRRQARLADQNRRSRKTY